MRSGRGTERSPGTGTHLHTPTSWPGGPVLLRADDGAEERERKGKVRQERGAEREKTVKRNKGGREKERERNKKKMQERRGRHQE